MDYIKQKKNTIEETKAGNGSKGELEVKVLIFFKGRSEKTKHKCDKWQRPSALRSRVWFFTKGAVGMVEGWRGFTP